MRIAVTGSAGFIGRHALAALETAGHAPVALDRSVVDHHAEPERAAAIVAGADALLHLAWPGLSDFRDPRHVTEWLPADARFLQAALSAGCTRLVVAGTCLEYGLRSGALREDLATDPILAYPIAKDALRRLAAIEAARVGASLAWARIFYLYGPGQAAKSLLAQLDAAIERGDAVFPMSGGEQLRDYSPVEAVAARLVALAASSASGPVNICSGEPISVRGLVERRIAERGAAIRPQLGVYPYPDYEPMAFWGDRTRSEAILNA